MSSSAYRRVQFIANSIASFTILYLISHLLTCMWIRINSRILGSPSDDYIDSYYFIFATATTLGYGDQTVDHKKKTSIFIRYLFAILIMVFSLIFYSFVQSKLLMIITSVESDDSLMVKYMGEFEEWMTVRNMTPCVNITGSYERKLGDFFTYMMRNDIYSVLNISGFIDQISYHDKLEIVSCATQEIIHNIKFFEEISEITSVRMVSAFRTLR